MLVWVCKWVFSLYYFFSKLLRRIVLEFNLHSMLQCTLRTFPCCCVVSHDWLYSVACVVCLLYCNVSLKKDDKDEQRGMVNWMSLTHPLPPTQNVLLPKHAWPDQNKYRTAWATQVSCSTGACSGQVGGGRGEKYIFFSELRKIKS